MIFKWLLDLLTSPVAWFWREYKKCVKKKDIARAFGLLFVSLCGLTVIGLISIFIIIKLIEFSTLHPNGSLVVIGVICLYIYMHAKSEKEAGTKDEPGTGQSKNDSNALREQGELGYAPMLNAMYQTLRDVANDIGGIIPTMNAEIEVYDGHYIIKNGVILYQFKLNKSDPNAICDDSILAEYANSIQFRLRNKIECGTFPSIKISHFRDDRGNGFDGIVVDHLDDLGRYYLIYAAYPSQEYADYRRSLTNHGKRNPNYLPTESWSN
ncbi:MAG: hypothetical protein K5673_08770 [Lachnospiraceae bacterium]|nr:hypothetical protein [Lachnospiraceae bacterium]